jgi:hypothetical protein
MRVTSRIIWLSSGLAIGLVVASYSKIQLDFTVGIVDVLTLIITVIIGLTLHHLATNVRPAKDLIIDKGKEALSELNSLRDIFLRAYQSGKLGTDDSEAIKNQLRTLANCILLVETIINHTSHDNSAILSVRSQYFRLKKVLTGGKFPTEVYREHTYNDEELIHRSMQKQIILFLIDLNVRNWNL